MRALLLHTTDLLQTGTPVARPARPPTTRSLLLMVLLFGATYGAAMGTFGGNAHPRLLQMLFSAIKVPLLLLATFSLSLPSYFVLNTLLGLRNDVGDAIRALLATQAGLTIILCAFAPFTLFWYASFAGYEGAVFFNTLMFASASVAGQFLLRRLYRPLIARDLRHRALLRLWLLIYAFVGIQMGWLLRPFIGDPSLPTRFLREDPWGNAYVLTAQRIWQLFTHQMH
jgi:hypothetical protein